MVDTLVNFWPLRLTIVVALHVDDGDVGNHGTIENLSIRPDDKLT